MTSQAVKSVALGLPVPSSTPHAISFSLPTWKDGIDWRKGEKHVIDALASGYPRFVIYPCVQKLFDICQQKFGMIGEKCLLFPSKSAADHCQAFIHDHAALEGVPTTVRLFQYIVHPKDTAMENSKGAELHVALFAAESYSVAFEFWKQTGLGISTRYAEHCLSLLSSKGTQKQEELGASGISRPADAMVINHNTVTCLEERDSPPISGASAKRILRRRIAELLTGRAPDQAPHEPCTLGDSPDGTVEIKVVSEDDVYLFPTGMAAIWNIHRLCLRTLPLAKIACFGFPYLETLKGLEKWGPGIHFFGCGLESDVDALEDLLARESSRDTTKPPILALFTEFTSNPLLRSPDLPRLRALADKYNFVLIIDDTIGSSVNVDVLPYADIVVTSLTKIFSGAANVMGGSFVLNPKGRHYATLTNHMDDYEDTYFDEDAIVMEYNSRDVVRRVRIIDENTEAVCAFLHARTVGVGGPSAVIKDLAYPKYTMLNEYLKCKRHDGGYGGLFSLTFTSLASSIAFYDALSCYKGPSLGTNFTLAINYSPVAFLAELEWAAQYGVEEASVRISVGMEDKGWLLCCMDTGLKAAESVQ